MLTMKRKIITGTLLVALHIFRTPLLPYPGLWVWAGKMESASLQRQSYKQYGTDRDIERKRDTGRGITEAGLREDVGCGRNGDKFSQDILGHFDIVFCNQQCLLNVLIGVALAHEVVYLAGDEGVHRTSATVLGDRAWPTLRVYPAR